MSAATPANEVSLKGHPIIATLGGLAFVNWFIFFGVSMYLHGDALRTLPSRDGFVLASHGNHTPVSESVWLFSLLYSGGTLLLTPLLFVTLGVVLQGGKLRRQPGLMKWLVVAFVLVWLSLWESGIGKSVYRSFNDWAHLKDGIHKAATP